METWNFYDEPLNLSLLVRHPAYSLVREVHYKLQTELGFSTLIVGGAIRSLLMHEPQLKDIDVATAAKPFEIQKAFKNSHLVIPVGIEFGSVRVYSTENPAVSIDVTTYRKDIKCTGRHAEVEFSNSIVHDVQRRDFTINGLVMTLPDFKIMDLVGGFTDLKNNIIKTIGNPQERFAEDYLRMLRACRFTALNEKMEIELNTLEAIKANAHKIHNTIEDKSTTDRQREELLKGMKYKFPSRMIEAMRYTGLLQHILPELEATIGVTQNKHHNLYKCDTCNSIIQYENDTLVNWPLIRKEK